MRPIIIGQAPARGNDGLLPFAGRSGARLAQLAGVGDSGDDLPRHFKLINILDEYPGKQGKGDSFDMRQARVQAQFIKDTLFHPDVSPKRILLMGKKVRRAMGVQGDWDYLRWFKFGQHMAAVFPHPSGVNRWWNDPVNETKAELFLRRLIHGQA